jgi:hypothetical protein
VTVDMFGRAPDPDFDDPLDPIPRGHDRDALAEQLAEARQTIERLESQIHATTTLGTGVVNERDLAREARVAQIAADYWGCEWDRLGPFAKYDVHLRRGLNVVAIAEIRTRNREGPMEYPTTLIDLDKWLVLIGAELSLNIPALYVQAYYSGVYYVRAGKIPAADLSCTYRGKVGRGAARNDASPVLELPSKWMRRIGDSDGVFEIPVGPGGGPWTGSTATSVEGDC